VSSSASRSLLHVIAVAVLLAFVITLFAGPVAGNSAKTKRVSVKGGGGESTGEVRFGVATSADGKLVVFQSSGSDLVKGDTNRANDLFIKNLKSGRIGRISVRDRGGQANAGSSQPSISDSGRFVAFRSSASDLVPGDRNNTLDIFLRDRKNARTLLISKSTKGVASDSGSFEPDISVNGQFITYYSIGTTLVPGDTNGFTDVFVYNRKSKKTSRISRSFDGGQANEDSSQAVISGNGRFVAFTSDASNLVRGDRNRDTDVFVYDRWKETTELVSVSSTGVQGDRNSFDPDISANGRYVVFQSWAGNLVNGDTNEVPDIFRHDRKTGKTVRVSVGPNGRQADGDSTMASISANGRWIAFESSAPDLIRRDTNASRDVFVRDMKTKKTRRVSLRNGGGQAEFGGRYPALSADARFIAFTSASSDIVGRDRNGNTDAFRRGALRE
jgi:hypothetical protein